MRQSNISPHFKLDHKEERLRWQKLLQERKCQKKTISKTTDMDLIPGKYTIEDRWLYHRTLQDLLKNKTLNSNVHTLRY